MEINLCDSLESVICKYLKNNVFTACSLGVYRTKSRAQSEHTCFYGTAGKAESKNGLDKDAVFDLASLTKPLVTVLSFWTLVEEGRCHIGDSLAKFFSPSVPIDKKAITIYQLLTHSSGLPPHQPYYENLTGLNESSRENRVVDWILNEKLQYEPGTETLYSDLGFILLGRIIEIVSGESLDGYWQRKIISHLQLGRDLFFASRKETDHYVYVPTGSCIWSNMSLYGYVHDDNCRALGGVAGHAGLFGTLGGVLKLCKELLLLYNGESEKFPFSQDTLHKMLENKKGEWFCGFDSPTPPLSSSGRYFSEKTIGHLGFTGTSFWIDLLQGVIVVLLTNRVYCGEELTGIKEFRPLIHDMIMEKLIKKPGKAV